MLSLPNLFGISKLYLFRVLKKWGQRLPQVSLGMVTQTPSHRHLKEICSNGECEKSEVPVKNLTWSDASSSDESPANVCSLNVSIF